MPEILYDSSLRVIETHHHDGFDRLVENIGYPLRDELLITALEKLVTEVGPHIGDYEIIIGDDISGRLPTLLFADLARRKRKQIGLPQPKVYFVNAGSNLRHTDEAKQILDQISDFIVRKKFPSGSKTLIVTEYIYSGHSISVLAKVLQKFNLASEVLAVSSHKHPLELKGMPGKIYIGAIGEIPGSFFYMNSLLSGLTSSEGSATAESYNCEEYRQKAVRARKDLKVVTDYLWQIMD